VVSDSKLVLVGSFEKLLKIQSSFQKRQEKLKKKINKDSLLILFVKFVLEIHKNVLLISKI